MENEQPEKNVTIEKTIRANAFMEFFIPSFLVAIVLSLFVLSALQHRQLYQSDRERFGNGAADIGIISIRILQIPAVIVRFLGRLQYQNDTLKRIHIFEFGGNILSLGIWWIFFTTLYRKRWETFKKGWLWPSAIAIIFLFVSLALTFGIHPIRKVGIEYLQRFHPPYSPRHSEMEPIPKDETELRVALENSSSIYSYFINGKLVVPAKLPPPSDSPPYELPKNIVEYFNAGKRNEPWIAAVGNLDEDPDLSIFVRDGDELMVMSCDQPSILECQGDSKRKTKGSPETNMDAINKVVEAAKTNGTNGVLELLYSYSFISEDGQLRALDYLIRQDNEAVFKAYVMLMNNYTIARKNYENARKDYANDLVDFGHYGLPSFPSYLEEQEKKFNFAREMGAFALRFMAESDDPRVAPYLESCFSTDEIKVRAMCPIAPEPEPEWYPHETTPYKYVLVCKPIYYNIEKAPITLKKWCGMIIEEQGFYRNAIKGLIRLQPKKNSFLYPYFFYSLQKMMIESIWSKYKDWDNGKLALDNVEGVYDYWKLPLLDYDGEADFYFSTLKEINEPWAEELYQRFSKYFKIPENHQN